MIALTRKFLLQRIDWKNYVRNHFHINCLKKILLLLLFVKLYDRWYYKSYTVCTNELVCCICLSVLQYKLFNSPVDETWLVFVCQRVSQGQVRVHVLMFMVRKASTLGNNFIVNVLLMEVMFTSP